MGMSTEDLEAEKLAYENFVKAAQEYARFAPKKPAPVGRPKIAPKIFHASPENFHDGYNMILDAGGRMPGKIPVVALPVRAEDVAHYKRFGTLGKFLRHLGVN